MLYTRLLAVALIAAPGLAVAPGLIPAARAQVIDPTPEVLQSELAKILSVVGDGLVAPRNHPPQVTRDGGSYRISIPLPGLTAPPNAVIDAHATPLVGGMWDVTSLTLPENGTLSTTPTGVDTPGNLSFSIAQQAIHARIDPSLSQPSPFAATFGGIAVRTEGGGQRAEQTIERDTLQGTLVADAAQHLNVQTLGSAANWRISTTDKAGVTVHSVIRSAAGSVNVEGLDGAQAQRLLAAGRLLVTDMQTARAQAAATPPGTATPPVLSPALNTRLRAIVDASAGLLNRLEVEDTLQGIHFDAPGGSSGDIGQMRLGLSSEARNDRLSAELDVSVNDLTTSALPVDLATYIPRHIDIKPAIAGVQIPQLRRLLRDATAVDPDQPTLRNEVFALLAEPDANIGIASLSFDSGSLRMTGSARLRPQVDGTPGIEIKLAATGLDALIAQAQNDPNVQQISPMLFLAKGMARPQGDSLVWDILLADGTFTVNGLAMGQPRAGPSPPSSR